MNSSRKTERKWPHNLLGILIAQKIIQLLSANCKLVRNKWVQMGV